MTSIDRLRAIMRRLRNPKHGCPWDIAQDFDTIAPYTIEESYEVADAIDRKDMNDLRDELGDLLFQVVFHAQMADETGAFTLDDVIKGICDKMERRHPHIFGSPEQIKAGVKAGDWEKHKERERRAKNNNHTCLETGTLDGIALTLPPLNRAQKLQDRAARVGFDWPDVLPIFDKLDEEVDELKEALLHPKNRQEIIDEFGDIMFVCVNLARKLNVDSDVALKRTNQKFERRFSWIEKQLATQNIALKDASLELMERYWVEAKTLARE